MKLLWNLLAAVLLINVLALGGVCAWMYASGRIDADRLRQARSLFAPTIAQAQRQEALAEQQAQEQREAQLQVARLQDVADGPVSVATRLATDQQEQEVAMQKIAWLRRTVQNLTARLESDKRRLEEMKADLEKTHQSFERSAAARAQQQHNEDFQAAVRMYEQLQAGQAKSMFLELISQGREQEVINYLASMQQRKAAAVLREFKTEAEIVLATNLLQQLAERGVQPVTLGDEQDAAEANVGGAT
jgi:hypothetical protein